MYMCVHVHSIIRNCIYKYIRTYVRMYLFTGSGSPLLLEIQIVMTQSRFPYIIYWFHTIHMYMHVHFHVRLPTPHTYIIADIHVQTLHACIAYHTALIFCGSKFLRIAAFDNFVEKISWIRCRSRQWCKVSKFLLKFFHECHQIHKNRKI